MKRSRFTEEQIIHILNEAQTGMKVEEYGGSMACQARHTTTGRLSLEG